MTDLTTTSQLPAKAVLTGCSPALSGLLAPSQSFLFAVDEIRKTPALHDEARAMLAELQVINRPATAKEIIGELAPLVALFGVQDKGEDEWAAFWKIYIEDLGRYPRWVIAEAAKRYRRQKDADWFPRPGPLRDLCEDTFSASSAAEHRLSRGLPSLPHQDKAA